MKPTADYAVVDLQLSHPWQGVTQARNGFESFFCPHKISNDLISAANQLTTLVESFTDSINISNDAGCSASAENVVLTGQQKATVVFNTATL